MAIEYRINSSVTAEAAASVFLNSGIRRPVDDLPRIARMLENANLTVTAWDGQRLVGIARAVTDFCYCCYLSDLAVDNAYQRQGIGTELIAQLRNQLTDDISLILVSAPESMSYYPHVGFEKTENAWIIRRKR